MVKTGCLRANSVITSSMSVMVLRKGIFNLFILLKLRLRLHGRGFQSKRFHDLETALKTTRFRRVYTEPIQPLNPTVYVRAISFSGVRKIFKEPPLTSYRKGKSLKDTLVRDKLYRLKEQSICELQESCRPVNTFLKLFQDISTCYCGMPLGL